LRKLPLILILICSITFSQNYNLKIDSLKSELDKNNSTQENSKIYSQIVNEFENSKINYDSAFYYANKGYEFTVEENLPKDQVNFLFKIATIYYSVKNYKKSLDYYYQALELAEKINYDIIIPSITNNIGDIYLIQKDYKNAEILFNKCLLYSKQLNNPRLEALEYINIGEVFYNTNKLEESIKFINKGIEKYKTVEDSFTSNYYIKAQTLLALNEYEKAKKSSLKGLEMSEKNNSPDFIYKHSILLSNIYSKTNQYKKAFYYSNQALNYKDSIDKKSEYDKLEKLILNFKVKEQEASLNSINQKNTFFKIIFSLVIIGVVLIIILIFRQLKITRMTKTIHDIQYSLIKHELDKKKNQEKSIIDAIKEGDKKLKE